MTSHPLPPFILEISLGAAGYPAPGGVEDEGPRKEAPGQEGGS